MIRQQGRTRAGPPGGWHERETPAQPFGIGDPPGGRRDEILCSTTDDCIFSTGCLSNTRAIILKNARVYGCDAGKEEGEGEEDGPHDGKEMGSKGK